jgi:hypothetical protein
MTVAEGTSMIKNTSMTEVSASAEVPEAGVRVYRIDVKEVADVVGTVGTALVLFLGLYYYYSSFTSGRAI